MGAWKPSAHSKCSRVVSLSQNAVNEKEMRQPLAEKLGQLRLLPCAFLLEPGLRFIGRPGPGLQTDLPTFLLPWPAPQAYLQSPGGAYTTRLVSDSVCAF